MLTLVLASGCADEPRGAGTWTPRPGESLLRQAERVRVDEHPRSSVPRDRWSLARRALDPARPREVPVDGWRVRRELGEEADAWGLPRDASLWFARAPVRPAGAVPWLVHEGRLLAPSTEKGGRAEDLSALNEWVDEVGGARFWWVEEFRELRAARLERPGELAVAVQALPGHPRGLESRLLGAGPPGRADALLERVTLQEIDRPCLLAPATTRLTLHVDLRHVDELSLQLGVFDPELVLGGAALVSDGVRFRVELDAGDGPRELGRRDVRPGTGWQPWRVALPETGTGGVTLTLISEPGAAGDATADWALWSDLRLLGPRANAPERPHVLVVDVDTLRADRLGLYGHSRDTSPRLDAWAAAHARVFEQAVSTNSWTLPATASMLTGLTVAEHGVWGFPSRLGAEHESLAVQLSQAGYETYAATEGGFVIPAFGFAHGFDVFDVSVKRLDMPERDGWRALRDELAARRSERPVFCFLQTYEVHEPYVEDGRFRDPARPPFDAREQTAIERDPGLAFVRVPRHGNTAADLADASDWYDAAVRRMDANVGAFLEDLPRVFGDEPYVVVLTSDHGEELGDRGQVGHAHGLHRELVHVPLLLAAPGVGPGRVAERVSLVDVVPTLLDAAGLPVPERLGGRSLLRAPSPRPLVAAQRPGAEALWADGYKLMTGDGEGAAVRLYDLARDPDERVDVAAERADEVARLRELLQAVRGREPAAVDAPAGAGLDAATLENLRALGYLGEDG